MEKLIDRMGKIWSSLLNEKSKNYLLRSKIDQSIAITNSNLSASFLGNRQMANHNTDDIKYCLNKIIEKNSTEPDITKLNVDLMFLKHRQKLNKRLAENSKILIAALEQLQLAHQRVMKANEEIVKFNSSMLETTSEIIATNELPIQSRLGMSEIQAELEKIEKGCLLSEKTYLKLIKKIEDISTENDSLSEQLDEKRKKINKNRDQISGVRADLSIWIT